nr:transporter substrate-binding domain-containing protein [Shewanella sp. VB17]
MSLIKKVLTYLFCSLLTSVTYAQTVITIATDETSGRPWIWEAGKIFNENNPGVELELYKLVEKKLDIKFKFLRLPWVRAKLYLQSGKIDGMFPTSFKTEREYWAFYPRNKPFDNIAWSNFKKSPEFKMDNNLVKVLGELSHSKKTRNIGYYLYKLKGSKIDWDGHKFLNVSKFDEIGVTTGYSINSKLADMGLKLSKTINPMQSLQMLMLGRITGIVNMETIIDTNISLHKEQFSKIIKSPIIIQENSYYLAFSESFMMRNSNTAEKIWQGIEDIKKTAEFSIILQKYSTLTESN